MSVTKRREGMISPARDTCPCHGVPWLIRRQHPTAGGTWLRQCRVKKRANERVRNARNNPRRVRDGDMYVAMAPRPEHAIQLNADLRRFRARQKQSRA